MIAARIAVAALAGVLAAGCVDPPSQPTAPDAGPPAVDAGPASTDVAPAPPGSDGGGAVDCMPPTHPGTITFVNEDTGEVTTTKAEDVPESIRFHATPAGRVPVVKVVRRTVGPNMLEVQLYGPCGQWLQTILARV